MSQPHFFSRHKLVLVGVAKRMRNIFTPAKVAVVALFTVGAYAPGSHAFTIAYLFSWQGNAGYTATGIFSYDSYNNKIQERIVTKDEITSLSINFYDPLGAQLQSFFYPPFTSEFNFYFDTTTETIFQLGNFDADGFNLGIDAGAGQSGIDFYSCNNSLGGCDFSTAGQGIILQLDNGSNSCVNPTNPNCVQLDDGGVLVITHKLVATYKTETVPEPTSTLSLLALGTLGAASTLKRQLKPSKSSDKKNTKVG